MAKAALMRARWPFSARTTSVIVLLVVGLGTAGAGLGLALANRGAIEQPVEVVEPDRTDRARAVERPAGPSKERDAPAHRKPDRRVRGHPLIPRIGGHFGDGRFGLPFVPDLGIFGREVIRGTVVGVETDSVLIETAGGERRRVQGTAGAREDFEAAQAAGEEVTVSVRAGLDGRLRFRGLQKAAEERPSHFADAAIAIAIGEVTAVSERSIGVHTILGNDVEISLTDAAQAQGIEVGDHVAIVASRGEDGLVARSVSRLELPFDLEFSERLRAFPSRRVVPTT